MGGIIDSFNTEANPHLNAPSLNMVQGYIVPKWLTTEDLDTIITPGNYYTEVASTCTNVPEVIGQETFALRVTKTGEDKVLQELIPNVINLPTIKRLYNGTTWGNWYGPAEDFYYLSGRINLEDLQKYYSLYSINGWSYSGTRISGYTGKPGSMELKYVGDVNDSSTYWVDNVFIPVFDKQYNGCTYEGSTFGEYRRGESSYISTWSTYQSVNQSFSINISLYSIGVQSAILYRSMYPNEVTYDVTTLLTQYPMDCFSATYNITVDTAGYYDFWLRVTYTDGTTFDSNTLGINIQSEGAACVTSDTNVLTPTGYNSIENLKVGDNVMSYNMKNNTTVEDTITAIKGHKETNIYKVYTDNDIIKATGDHPFYVVNKGKIFVSDLEIGDILLNADNSYIVITNIEKVVEECYVYDINTSNNNYFVGESSVLVFTEDCVINI